MSTTVPVSQLPIGNRLVRSPGWWGMVWLIATEGALISFMFFSYFYLASQFRGPWPPGGALDLKFSIPETVILVGSGLVMWWAWRGIKQGDQMRLRFGLLAVFALGCAWLALEIFEMNQSFGPSSSSFAAVFYAISGADLAHAILGLVMLVFVQIWAWMGMFTAERHLAVSNVAMFWQFVVIVWVAVFVIIYLSPRM